jgi:hypothetical protein
MGLKKRKVLVFGGGVGGLSAAHELCEGRGVRIRVNGGVDGKVLKRVLDALGARRLGRAGSYGVRGSGEGSTFGGPVCISGSLSVCETAREGTVSLADCDDGGTIGDAARRR